MENQIIEKLITTYKADPAKIWSEFSELASHEREAALVKLLELATSPKHNNKAVVMPNVASVIKRKLKHGVKFETWYQEWLPPIKSQVISNDVVRDYFPVPTRVINLRLANEQDFLTIGFVYNPFDTIEELMSSRPKEVTQTESRRRGTNEDLLEVSEAEFYAVSSDDIFGV